MRIQRTLNKLMTIPGKIPSRILTLILLIPFHLLNTVLVISPLIRKIFFNTSKADFLVSDGEETFVVSSKDKMIGREIFSRQTFDLDKFIHARTLADMTTEDMTFVDVGANIGVICLPLLKRKLISKAIAIEPEPLNLKLLKANVVLNDLEDEVEVVGKALGDENGVIEFELSEKNFGDHRIRRKNDGIAKLANKHDETSRKVISVDVVKLDDVLKSFHSGNLFLWMDTQGYEGFVLKGATDTLSKGYPLVIEFWPYGMNRSGSFVHLKESLLASPYTRFFNLNLKHPLSIDLTSEALDALYEELGETGSFTDLLVL